MADNYLNPSPYPTSDAENPSPASKAEAPPNNSAKCNSLSTSTAAKLALGLIAVAGAVALGVAFGLNSGSDNPDVVQTASSSSSVKRAENYALRNETKSSSVTALYETCSDLEKDITEALVLYISNYIKWEAENEVYANCDPDNENWMMEYNGYDGYYYDDYCE
jgi:hypothetical protein